MRPMRPARPTMGVANYRPRPLPSLIARRPRLPSFHRHSWGGTWPLCCAATALGLAPSLIARRPRLLVPSVPSVTSVTKRPTIAVWDLALMNISPGFIVHIVHIVHIVQSCRNGGQVE
mgnify:CR=1 FL=1